MKHIFQTKQPWAWLASCLAIWLVAGCATSERGSRAARPGDGLREYQRLVLDLREDATRTRQSVEALTTATRQNFGAAYARFDESLQRLEVVSIQARARADAVEKRGAAYFEEWTAQISGSADEASHGVANARFAELHRHFEAILKDSGQVRLEFRSFLDGVRRLRTALGPKPELDAIEKAGPDFAQLVADGGLAEGKMDQLLKTLEATEAALMAGPMPPIKSGE
jgi:hypothetical protein